MKKEMSTESASPDQVRMMKYKVLATAFSYPGREFFAVFPEQSSDRDVLVSEYDRLFRAKEIWLYSTEYLAENEFQRSNYLSDIMGFYRAFGVEPSGDRPDSLSSEFEFMHYLIYKTLKASEQSDGAEAKERVSVCLDAQKKFFGDFIHSSAKQIAEAVTNNTENSFYGQISNEMLDFLNEEKAFLEGIK